MNALCGKDILTYIEYLKTLFKELWFCETNRKQKTRSCKIALAIILTNGINFPLCYQISFFYPEHLKCGQPLSDNYLLLFYNVAMWEGDVN